MNLELPEENRNLNVEEIVTLCREFLIAGTDTTLHSGELYLEIARVVGEKQSKLTD